MRAGKGRNIETAESVERLHSSPLVALRILELLKDPEFDFGFLEKHLESDPALAASVLRLVNSSSFGLSQKVCSLRQAITYLGARSLRLVMLSFGLVGRLTRGAPAQVCQEYWRRALTMASAASCLCPRGESTRPDEAYTAGLLADVGVLLFAQTETERYVDHCGQLAHGADLLVAEENLFGLNHADLGARLLRRWNLPSRLSEAVLQHHDSDSGRDLLSRLVAAGDMLAEALWTPETPRMGDIRRHLQSQFDIDLDGFIALAIECKRDIMENAAVFRVELHGSIDCEALREQAVRLYEVEAMGTALDLDSMTAVFECDYGGR